MQMMRRGLIGAAFFALAACAGTGDVSTGDTEEELSTSCPNPAPKPPGPCWNVTCDIERKAWDFEPKPSGARCGNGTCDDSGTCVLPAPPTAPTSVQIVDRRPTTTTLSWTAGAGATHYQVSTNGAVLADTTATTATVGGLNQSTQYCFTVTAVGPGGVASAAPVCAYTGFYVPLGYGGTLLDRIPWVGQSPQMAARVERIMLAPQDLGGAGFTLVRPNGHGSDCTAGNPNLAISLLPGQSVPPWQLYNLLGEANPPLGQYGFGFGAGGLWFGGCTQVPIDVRSTVWLEVNFVPASTIHVVSATYGANVGASGNLTFGAGFVCNGEVFCASTVAGFTNFQPVGDPAPGQAKDFVAQWTCGSDPTLRSTTVPAEAAPSVAVLECP